MNNSCDILDKILYLQSGLLLAGGCVQKWLQFVDSHVWVVGAILGLLTWVTNLIFKIIRLVWDIRKTNKLEECHEESD
jgi:hypothetical protein